MRPILGFVIQNSDGLLFTGYRHPGTRKAGSPIWVRSLVNANFDGGHAAIYENLKDAADIALSIFTRDSVHCSAKPVGIVNSDSE